MKSMRRERATRMKMKDRLERMDHTYVSIFVHCFFSSQDHYGVKFSPTNATHFIIVSLVIWFISNVYQFFIFFQLYLSSVRSSVYILLYKLFLLLSYCYGEKLFVIIEYRKYVSSDQKSFLKIKPQHLHYCYTPQLFKKTSCSPPSARLVHRICDKCGWFSCLIIIWFLRTELCLKLFDHSKPICHLV